LSSYRKCSKRRTLDHSTQATALLPIAGTTKRSRVARGFGFGGDTVSVAARNIPNSDQAILKGKLRKKSIPPIPFR
jgi:hypothetical protein